MPRPAKLGKVELHPVTQFMTFHGGATVWDDLRFSVTGAKIDNASTRYEHDVFNGGINFHADARYTNEPVSMVGQMPHGWKLGSTIYPHIHWLQPSADEPNWLLLYKVMTPGEAGAVEVNYNNHTKVIKDHVEFTYTAGVLNQETFFPPITMVGCGLSCVIHFVLFRDTANASGLFAGADPSALDEVVQEFDVHFEMNSVGSSQEDEKLSP